MKFVEVRYQPERSKVYLGSPSLVRLPDGALLCSHDYFGELKTLEGDIGLSSIYRSEDDGQTWDNVTHIINAVWGNLFVVKDAVYLISMTREHGDIAIRKSVDGGFTWSIPKRGCGILLDGPKNQEKPEFRLETSGMGGIFNGRLYKAYDKFTYHYENLQTDAYPISWCPDFFSAYVMSASLEDDLLDPRSWTHSNPVPFDKRLSDIAPETFKPGSGWLEGTIVKAPDGKMVDISRIHSYSLNKAVYMTLSDDGSKLEFDCQTGIIDFPSSPSRFLIMQDPRTGLYITFSNPHRHLTADDISSRNILTMCVSDDLRHWREVKDVITDDTGLSPSMSINLTGFQYNSWLFDGDDILLLSRMGYRGAHNYHDSNRIGFFRFKNFRGWI